MFLGRLGVGEVVVLACLAPAAAGGGRVGWGLGYSLHIQHDDMG